MKKFSFLRIHFVVFAFLLIIFSGLFFTNLKNVFFQSNKATFLTSQTSKLRKKKIVESLFLFSVSKVLARETTANKSFITDFLKQHLSDNLSTKPIFSQLVFYEEDFYESVWGDAKSFFDQEKRENSPDFSFVLNSEYKIFNNFSFLKNILEKPLFQKLLALIPTFSKKLGENNPQPKSYENHFQEYLASDNYLDTLYKIHSWEDSLDIFRLLSILIYLPPEQILEEIWTYFSNIDDTIWNSISRSFKNVAKDLDGHSDFLVGFFKKIASDKFTFFQLVRKLLRIVDLFVSGHQLSAISSEDISYFGRSEAFRLIHFIKTETNIDVDTKTITGIVALGEDAPSLTDLENHLRTQLDGNSLTTSKFLNVPQIIISKLKKILLTEVFAGFSKKIYDYVTSTNPITDSNFLLELLFPGMSTDLLEAPSAPNSDENFLDDILKIFKVFVLVLINDDYEQIKNFLSGSLSYFLNFFVQFLKSFNLNYEEFEPLKNDINSQFPNGVGETVFTVFSQLISYLQEAFVSKIDLSLLDSFFQFYPINFGNLREILNDEMLWTTLSNDLLEITEKSQKLKSWNNLDDSFSSPDSITKSIQIENLMAIFANTGHIFQQISQNLFQFLDSTNIKPIFLIELIEKVIINQAPQIYFLINHVLQFIKFFLTKINFKVAPHFFDFASLIMTKLLRTFVWLLNLWNEEKFSSPLFLQLFIESFYNEGNIEKLKNKYFPTGQQSSASDDQEEDFQMKDIVVPVNISPGSLAHDFVRVFNNIAALSQKETLPTSLSEENSQIFSESSLFYTKWTPLEINTIINNFSEFFFSFFDQQTFFLKKLDFLVNSLLSSHFHSLYDFRNWVFSNIEISEETYQANTNEISEKNQRVSFRMTLPGVKIPIFTYDFVWEIDIKNSSIKLVSWNPINS